VTDSSNRPRRWVRRCLRFLAGPLLIVSALTAAAPAAHAYPGPPSSVFDRNIADVVTIIDLSERNFMEEFQRLNGMGYMMIDLEVRSFGGFAYSAVLQRRPPLMIWNYIKDATPTAFWTKYLELAAQGLRIADFEIYTKNGSVRYAGIWVDGAETANSVLQFASSATAMRSIIDQQSALDRLPLDIEEYSVDGCSRCFVSIWVDNVENLGWQIWFGLSDSAFAAKFEELRHDYRMVAIQSNLRIDEDWPDPDEAWNVYAGIWHTDPKNRGWVERRDIPDRATLQQINAQYIAAGYRPLAIENYERKKNCDPFGCTLLDTFAGIWRQNT
jgi:hypothetical protein